MTLLGKLKYWARNARPGDSGKFNYFGTEVHFPRWSQCVEAACEQGIFENDNVRILCQLSRHDVVLDVGANIGLLAVPILASNSQCRVISFEPSPNATRWLERTIQGSAARDRWELVRCAVGEKKGKSDFASGSPRMGMYDGLRRTGRATCENISEVEVTTLDDEWAKRGKPQIDVIKIDVEGAEAEVLLGASELIKAQKPPILTEWNRENVEANGHDVGWLHDFAKEQGYQLQGIPSMARVTSKEDLAAHMLLMDSFLLIPKGR